MSANDRTLCCYGAGGHGRAVAGQWHARTGCRPVFADASVPVGSDNAGFPVRYRELRELQDEALIVTVGDNAARRIVQLEAVRLGIELASFVADPANYFAEAPRPGSVVLAGAVVNPAARIGAGVIVNTSVVIEHDCVLGDFAHVSTNATLAGGVRIGEAAWVGAGAVLLPGVVIVAGTVIGAGAVVTRNVAEPGTYAGVPARRIS